MHVFKFSALRRTGAVLATALVTAGLAAAPSSAQNAPAAPEANRTAAATRTSDLPFDCDIDYYRGYVCVTPEREFTGGFRRLERVLSRDCRAVGKVRSAWNRTGLAQRFWQNSNCTGENILLYVDDYDMDFPFAAYGQGGI